MIKSKYTSNHRGISYCITTKKWSARIMVNKKRIHLGDFKNEIEAIQSYEQFIDQNNIKNKVKMRDLKILPKDNNGLFIKRCLLCGKIEKRKNPRFRDLCNSCSQKNIYNNGIKGNGYKEVNNIEEIIKNYESNMSLFELSKKYGFSTDVIVGRMRDKRHKLRTRSESAKIRIGKVRFDPEWRKKLSAGQQGIPIEKWEKFLKPENERLWNNFEYREWRKSVLKRDNYLCALCNEHEKEMHAHHILTKAKYPHLIFDINNGITLCEDCHFCKINNHEEQYEQFFLDILKNKCIK